MEWRITKTNSGYHAEYGGYVEAEQENDFCIGFIIPGFIWQKTAKFETEKGEKKYI